MYRNITLAVLLTLLALSLPSCKRNQSPDTPAPPVGPTTCAKDTVYTFRATGVDPDGDSIALRIDWGDQTTSPWSAWVAGGDTVSLVHSWVDTGRYDIRAQVQDRHEKLSDWSDAAKVAVILARLPGVPERPAGPSRGGEDSLYTFGASAVDPDGDSVSLGFLWGDGDSAEWSPLVASGETAWMSHVWAEPDSYYMWVRSSDKGGGMSAYAGPFLVDIRPEDTLCRWKLRVSHDSMAGVRSSPAIGPDGTVYVGSTDSAVYAVNPDGTLMWRYPTGGRISSSAALGADGTVYIGSDDEYLYALTPDGSLKWRYQTTHPIRSSPAIGGDGTVYVCGYTIYALNPDGSPRWSRSNAGRDVRSSPAIGSDGALYFGTSDGYVVALNPDSTLKWQYQVWSDVLASPAIGSDGAVYVGDEGTSFWALNPDGSLRWSVSVGPGRSSSPVIGPDSTVYVGSGWGLSAFSPDGVSKWRCAEVKPYYAVPAIAADGAVYVGSRDGHFYCLNPDGTVRWKYLVEADAESSPAIAPDGTIYFCADDGYLYALKGTQALADSPWPKFHHDLRNSGRVGGP